MTATCLCCGDPLPPAERHGLSVDLELCRVQWQGRPIRFAPAEARLLHLLVRRGRASRDALILSSLGEDGSASALSVHIHRIRRSLADQGVPIAVTTIPRFGYAIEEGAPC